MKYMFILGKYYLFTDRTFRLILFSHILVWEIVSIHSCLAEFSMEAKVCFMKKIPIPIFPYDSQKTICDYLTNYNAKITPQFTKECSKKPGDAELFARLQKDMIIYYKRHCSNPKPN